MATTKTKKKTKAEVTTALNVAFVIDMSGSMTSLRNAAIEGANTYIRDLASAEDAETTRLTFVAFDDLYEVWFDDVSVVDAPMVSDQYVPRGSTALYDAIGKTIALLDGKKRADEKHLIVILTDGFENASTEHTADSLATLIDAYEKRGNWTFVYLGANDANVKDTASRLNIPAGNAAYYAANHASTGAAMRSAGQVTNSVKSGVEMASLSAFADAGTTDDYRDVNFQSADVKEPEKKEKK